MVQTSPQTLRVIASSYVGDNGTLCAAHINSAADELERLQANIDRLSANPADHRYWEGRYRDEAADNDRLKNILRRIDTRTRAGETLQQRIIGVRVLCKEALGWSDELQEMERVRK